MTDDTIAAIATPLGSGGLGVIRVSGPAALSVADAVFRSSRSLREAPSHTLHHGRLLRGDLLLDDAVAGVFRAPRSYTGEDVVEFSCHGGPALLRDALEACLAAGARTAEPGEFTKRAFLNGKMDLAQAEAVALLIGARSASARRWALEQLEGGLSRRVEALRREALALLAGIEASLDFAEEEVPDLAPPELARRAGALETALRALLATAPRGRLHREGLRAVLAGLPNAGKSSLFNALLGRDRAIVTPAAGTTRDTLEESFTAEDLPVVLTDTAGLREGDGAAEAEGVARARAALARADAVVWVLDASRPLDGEALAVREDFPPAAPVIAVLHKSDLLPPRVDRMALTSRLPGTNAVFASSVTEEGLAELRRLLARALPADTGAAREADASPTLLNDRHESLVAEAAEAAGRARNAAAAGEPAECAALELRRALDALDRVTGRSASEELLDQVFSTFCIGK
jgi:tRNA modification GTPase